MVTAASRLLWGLQRSRSMGLLLGLVLLSATIPARADTTVQEFRVFVSAGGNAITVMVQWKVMIAESGTSFVVYRTVDGSQGDQVCVQDYIGPGPYRCSDEEAVLDLTYTYRLVERNSLGAQTILANFGPVLLQQPAPTPTPTGTATVTPAIPPTSTPTAIPATTTAVPPTDEALPPTVEPPSPPATRAVQPVPATPALSATPARIATTISAGPTTAAQPTISPTPTLAVRPSPAGRQTPAPDVLIGDMVEPRKSPAEPTPATSIQALGPASVLFIVAAVAGVAGITLGIVALVLWRRGIRL